MAERVSLLDHGYLELVETWGSDERIIEAARMSTGKGFLGWGPFDCPDCKGSCKEKWFAEGYRGPCKKCLGTGQLPGDERLLRYLWTHQHTTPFEVPGLTVEVGCPVVVVWQ